MASADASIKGVAPKRIDGRRFKVGIVYARWNSTITHALLEGAKSALLSSGVMAENISVYDVPGSFELPYAASRVVAGGVVDAVICIGCLIKGETMHFEYIAGAVSDGIMQLGLKSGLVEGKGHNHGLDWGAAAIEMAALAKSV